MMTKPLLLAAAIGVVTLAISGTASAASSVLGVTTPAGYIPMVKALNQVCEAPGVKIEGHFGGNTGQQIAQIEAGSGVSGCGDRRRDAEEHQVESDLHEDDDARRHADDACVEERTEPQGARGSHRRLCDPHRSRGSEGRDLWPHRGSVAFRAEA